MTDTTKTLSKEDLISYHVRMGQLVDIELSNVQRDRFKCRLVGLKDGQYLILEQPDIRQYGSLRDQVHTDQALVFRTICEKTTGECLGFRSLILGTTDSPFRLFFIDFPKNVETHELRNEARKFILLQAFIFKNKQSERMEGVITDLSEGGCRFEFKVKESILKIKTEEMNIEFIHPDTDQSTIIKAKVCSQRKEQNKISLGLSFN